MKYSHFLVVGLTAFALTACGGGGDSSTPAANATPVATGTGTTDASGGTASTPVNPGMTASGFDATEFLGEWRRTNAASCHSGFDYNPAYYFKNDKIVISAIDIVGTQTVYTDAACTLKAGTVTETLNLVFSAATVAGKTNVARVSANFAKYSQDTDGGSGITLTSVPGKTPDDIKGVKSLFDVDGNKLFLGDRSVLGADGYPTTLNPIALYVR